MCCDTKYIDDWSDVVWLCTSDNHWTRLYSFVNEIVISYKHYTGLPTISVTCLWVRKIFWEDYKKYVVPTSDDCARLEQPLKMLDLLLRSIYFSFLIFHICIALMSCQNKHNSVKYNYSNISSTNKANGQNSCRPSTFKLI